MTKKKTKIEKMTIEEFKTFIKGLSFFDENWCPNKEQWEHIKQLIDNLRPDEPRASAVQNNAQNIVQERRYVPAVQQHVENLEGEGDGRIMPPPKQSFLDIPQPKPVGRAPDGTALLPPAREAISDFF